MFDELRQRWQILKVGAVADNGRQAAYQKYIEYVAVAGVLQDTNFSCQKISCSCLKLLPTGFILTKILAGSTIARRNIR